MKFDVYEQLELLGSIDAEDDKLVITGPEKAYLEKLVNEFFPNMSAVEVVKEFPKRFSGVTHCVPHGQSNVHSPD